ncbi:MAG: LacI family transcriptional regulator [Planctomycetes bacterium]|nr:LacI family transcriptional regulator [Planctomycetota bacterium]
MESIVINTNYDVHRTLVCVKRLLGLRVPGVAILTSQIDPCVMEMLVQEKVGSVYLDLGRVDRFVSNIVLDYENGIGQAMEHLRALGHREVGFIGGPLHLHSADRRRRAFLDCAGAGRPIVARTVESDLTVKGGYFACSRLLSTGPLSAIVAANDLMAIGAMHCAYDKGIAVPAELSIVGFDNITFSEYVQPALTTVAVPRSKIGTAAFQALWDMLADDSRPGNEYRVETSLVVRQSTAPARTGWSQS